MGRVLVVEDDRAICDLITDILAEAGITTRCAYTDREAYDTLAAPAAFDALILDINLGRGTTCYDIARAARRTAPGLPVIYVSGEADAEGVANFGVPGSLFVSKPFDPKALLAALRARLPGNAAAD
jgi:DNA-binding response OmpR family regulator